MKNFFEVFSSCQFTQVKTFLHLTREVVILNFHRFLPELDDLDDAALEEEELRHSELQGVLEAVFGADLFPFWPSRSGTRCMGRSSVQDSPPTIFPCSTIGANITVWWATDASGAPVPGSKMWTSSGASRSSSANRPVPSSRARAARSRASGS